MLPYWKGFDAVFFISQVSYQYKPIPCLYQATAQLQTEQGDENCDNVRLAVPRASNPWYISSRLYR